MYYLYIAGTIIFTVYGQIVVKWRISKYNIIPESTAEKLLFLLKLLIDPFILSGLFCAFLAALCWMIAMTKFELSYAYPFSGLNFVFVLILSSLMLNEPFSIYKMVGILFIIIGIIISSRSM
jgi:multidrug transporter EmrE-like cation transporter